MGKMGISMVSWNGFEEKDVLGTLALKSEEKGLDVRILTGNQDFLQLAREKIGIRLLKTARGQAGIEDYHEVQQGKEFETIHTDCPIGVAQEKFRLKDIYTKEAYELCRKLEFKSFLAKFDPAQVNENTMEQNFFTCSDFDGCESLFEKAGLAEATGIEFSADKDSVYGLGARARGKRKYIIFLQTGTDHARRMSLCKAEKTGREPLLISAMDIKVLC